MKAIVRRVSPRLGDGIVTYLERRDVDVGVAREQWRDYAAAFARAGWELVEAPAADDCPDGVFVEDALVVFDDLAVVTRPGAPARRAETDGLARTAAGLGMTLARIEPPGTLEGGDVLTVGGIVYVGIGGRTNVAGARQLRALLEPRGFTVVEVPVRNVLHLKSAVTALPDGTIVAHPATAPDAFAAYLAVPEPSGAHVVALSERRLLLAADCPRTAELLAARGYEPVTVDIGEFQKLEACVTCLSVRKE